LTDPWLFLLATLTLLIAPGPTNALLAAAGATAGLVRPAPLLGGVVAGYLLAIFAVRLALQPIISAYPAVGVALKVAAALYLVWLAVRLWRRPLADDTSADAVSLWSVFVTTLMNPKGLIFALTIFPSENMASLAWYTLGFVAAVAATGGAWIALGWGLKRAAGSHASHLPRVASVALIGFAGLILRAAF
jgi:threonine/homoserine/homoserine lactone efflux protein